tara:strand:+ start:4269 stop:4523 length:255 start_codon:yes stop_codon:yes gene_type:complete
MAKISTYATATPVAADLVLGTDSGSADATKNFTVQSLFDAAITLTAYDDDAAAGVGGLVAGQLYQTTGAGAAPLNAAGIVMVKQ